MQQEENKKAGGGKVGAAVTGAAIGAAVAGTLALLFAPKSGKETREDIQKAVDDAKAKVEDLVDKLPKSREELQAMVDEQINRLWEEYDKLMSSDIADDARQELENAKSEVENKYNELKDSADDMYKDGLVNLERLVNDLSDKMSRFVDEQVEK